jgi:hypothetical protein
MSSRRMSLLPRATLHSDSEQPCPHLPFWVLLRPDGLVLLLMEVLEG